MMKLQIGDIIEVTPVFGGYLPNQGEHEIIRVTPTTAVSGMLSFNREFEPSDCGRYAHIAIKGAYKMYSARYHFKKKAEEKFEFILPKEYQD